MRIKYTASQAAEICNRTFIARVTSIDDEFNYDLVADDVLFIRVHDLNIEKIDFRYDNYKESTNKNAEHILLTWIGE